MAKCIACGKELRIRVICKECSSGTVKGITFISLLCPYCGGQLKATNPGLFGREWKCQEPKCGMLFYLEEL